MKTLSLNRPLILMLVGLPGSGKSFFGRQFAEMFAAPLVSQGRLRYELFAEPSYTDDEQEVLQRVADYQIEELLKTHRSFVVDGGCNARPERQKLEQLAKTSKYGTLIIWVQTDEQTCRQRASKRNPQRSPDDVYANSLSQAQWASLAQRFTQPKHGESYMVISGKHAFSTQAKMVLRKLTAPHAEEAASAHQQELEHAAPPSGRERPHGAPRAPERPPAPGRRSVMIT